MWQIGTLAPSKPEDFPAVAHSEQRRPRLRYSVQCPSLSANAPCPEISPAQTHSRSMGSGFPGGTDLRTRADCDQRARSDSDPNALGQITSIILFLSAMGTLGPCGSICRPVTHLGGRGSESSTDKVSRLAKFQNGVSESRFVSLLSNRGQREITPARHPCDGGFCAFPERIVGGRKRQSRLLEKAGPLRGRV